jgi:hypothetical protein
VDAPGDNLLAVGVVGATPTHQVTPW